MLITACRTSTRFIYYSQFHSDDSNYFLKLKCQIFSNWQSVILKGKSIHIYLCCSCKSSLLEPRHCRIVTLEMQQYYCVKYTTLLGCSWAGFVVWPYIVPLGAKQPCGGWGVGYWGRWFVSIGMCMMPGSRKSQRSIELSWSGQI